MDKDGYHGYYRDEPYKQRTWVGLTEEERKEIWMGEVKDKKDLPWIAFVIQAIKDTEQKLKEKNT